MHPGGEQATRRLLDLADVGEGTRMADLGCGTGRGIAVAEALGADAVGLDREGPVCGDLASLPFADDAFDVAISECAICLADDLDAALAEARRVLRPGGRLADVVADEPPDLPGPVARMLCLAEARAEADLVDAIQGAGLSVETVRDRSRDLLTFRDRVRDRVDVEGLLSALGDEGRWTDAIDRAERAVETGTVGYVHVLATA